MKQFLLAFALTGVLPLFAQTWQPVASGLNSSTHGLCLWNNTLVDVGSFGSPCGRVASWDGTTWSCMAGGVGLVGRAAIEYNGDLIVVGDFWNINQPCTNCNGIARWDGTSWQALGTGFNNDVLCLAVWNGELVAGGDFTTADGNPCSRIARWNGTTWVAMGGVNDFDNDIRGLAVYNGELWAGGDFANVGGCTACDRVVKWNGSAWVGGNSGVDIPGGLDSTVRCFYVDQQANLLYMGGHFLEVAGNTNSRGVAVYDGNAWSSLGSGVDNYVRGLGKYNGNIIVGGDFLTAGSVPANKIAKWNPNTSAWSAMGTGMNDYVKAIEVYNGELYAGGAFTTADGLPRAYIARWYELPPPVAAFTPAITSLCTGQCIDFTDNTTNTPTSWNWSFPGAVTTSSTAQHPLNICYNTPGTYTVTLQACNASGCNSTSQTITVTNNTPPVVNVSAGQTTICSGDATTLTASGATTYIWSPPSGLSSTSGAVVSASPSVTTTYTVTGTNGCSATNTITITVNQGPAITLTPATANICSGGSVVLNASGALGYSWAPPSGLSSTSGATVTASPALSTTYSVTGTGSNGCTTTQTVAVTVSLSQTLPVTEGFQQVTFLPANWTMIDDANDNNTWQHNTAVGGFSSTGNCAYFPNNSINAPNTRDEMRTMKLNFGSLTTAQMTFDVAYARQNGPSSLDTLIVLVSTDCEQTWTQVYNKGGSTLATAPNQNSAFTPSAAQWRTETINLNSYIGQGGVTVAFQNRNHNGNNLYVDNINITGTNTNPPTPAILLSGTSVCPGSCITVTDNTSGLPTSWSWSFPGGTPASSTQQNPGSVCYNTPGTYTVTLQACNGNGCNTTTQTVVVNQPGSLTLTGNNTLCAGSSTTLSASGGSSAYLWTPAAGLSCTSCPSPTATPAVTTTYTVTSTDANGCPVSDVITVTVFQPGTVAVAAAPDTICNGSSVQLFATGGSSAYQWSPSGSLSCSVCPSPVANPNTTTSYTVTTTDVNGCVITDVFLLTVEICTGVENTLGTATFGIFPNPNDGVFTVTLAEAGTLTFYNSLGQTVHRQKNSTGTCRIELPRTVSGMVFVTFVSESGKVAGNQFVITR